jgi:hypothetical protein
MLRQVSSAYLGCYIGNPGSVEQTLDYLIVMKPVTGIEIRTEGLQFFTSISEQFFKLISASSNFYAKV